MLREIQMPKGLLRGTKRPCQIGSESTKGSISRAPEAPNFIRGSKQKTLETLQKGDGTIALVFVKSGANRAPFSFGIRKSYASSFAVRISSTSWPSPIAVIGPTVRMGQHARKGA